MQEKNELDIQRQILEIIYRSIDDLGEEVQNLKIEKKPETALLGRSSVLDSLTLVNLIVAVEQAVEDEFGMPITAIANEKAMSQEYSPLRTIGTLSEFITSILIELTKG